MEKVYCLRSYRQTPYFFGESNIEEKYEDVHCTKTKMHWRLGKRLTRLDINIPYGDVDMVWTSVNECLISDRLLNIFKENEVTGFTVHPANVTYRDSDKKAPKFWELVVTGWGGVASEDTGIKQVEYCEECKKSKFSKPTHPEKLFNEENWDGSDMFLIWPLPGFRLVTKKVFDILEQNDIKHYEKISISEMVRKKGNKTLSPGKLRYLMPEERAREIGEPLGIY